MLGIKKRDTKQVFKDVQAEFSSYFGKKRPTPEEYVYTMATKIKY